MALLNFDATQHAPDGGVMDPIPEGWYNVMIDDSDMKPTKNGDGAILNVRFKVIDGDFKNRTVMSRLNVRNTNEVAQRIALGHLSAIAHAVKVLNVVDSNMLHNIPLKIRVKILEQDGYSPSNEVIAFKDINEIVAANKPVVVVPLTPTTVAPLGIPAVFTPLSVLPAIGMAIPTPVAAPAILGAVPAPQAWGTAPVAPAPVAVAPLEQVVVAIPEPAAVAPIADAPFDPATPPAWMTK